jgi:hypothetical protein
MPETPDPSKTIERNKDKSMENMIAHRELLLRPVLYHGGIYMLAENRPVLIAEFV